MVTLNDNTKAREQKSDGSYHYVKRLAHDQPIQSQLHFYEMAARFTENERTNSKWGASKGHQPFKTPLSFYR